MSLAITFHVARLAASRAFSAASCALPNCDDSGVSAGCRLSLLAPR